jgi:hypothetical protein
MGVEAILLRYLIVLSGVELFAENISANKPTLDGLSVRQRYEKNLIRVLCVFICEISAKVKR